MAPEHPSHNEALRVANELNEFLASKYAREVVARVTSEVISAGVKGGGFHGDEQQVQRPSVREKLRSLNPERFIRRTIRKRFPKKGVATGSPQIATPAEYFDVQVNGISIRFGTGTLVDSRGVGRVAREILRELVKREALTSLSCQEVHKKPIHFFPSVHWCPAKLPQRSVVMVHDVIPLLFESIFQKSTIAEWRQKHIPIIRNADVIVTVSESSAEDISRVIGIPRDKIHVIYNGVDVSMWEEDSGIDCLIPDAPYFVCIGSNDYHKNIDVVINAMAFIAVRDFHLVVVGKSPKGFSTMLNTSHQGRVHTVGRLTDGQLARILRKSKGLLFPSLYEGFGLPPLESLMLSVPCICSERPAMTELLRDSVTFCDPDNPFDWANAMYDLAKFPPGMDDRRKIATKLRDQFSWERSTDLLLGVFNEMEAVDS